MQSPIPRAALAATSSFLLLALGALPLLGRSQAQESAQPLPQPQPVAVATFAGGCFWCMEPPFDELPGVLSTTSGYTGGATANATYEQVSDGTTGHAEVVQVRFDPAKVSYDELLKVFWRNIDPLTPDAQFCDQGAQYRSAIFYHDAAQRAAAEKSRAAIEKSKRFDRPIVTQIVPVGAFYAAEAYHQDYYVKNPLRYKFYRTSCGRDRRLKELWD